MSSEKTSKTATKTDTSAATADSTATEGQKTKRKNAETPGSINKRQKTTNAVEGETDSEEGEDNVKGDGDKKNKKDKITCLVRPDEAWKLVVESHHKKKPAKSYEKFLETAKGASTLTPEEIDNIIAPKKLSESSFDEYWTRQDEDDLQKAWADDPDRSLWMNVTCQTVYAKTWRVFLRLFRKSPVEIISAKYALQFGRSSRHIRKVMHIRDGQEQEVDSPVWGLNFMKKMRALAHHPLWQGKADYLIVALQYAVIVRTNDCRTWKLLNPGGDEFFNTMIRVIKQHKNEVIELPELHKIARDDMRERDIPRGWFSVYMKKLESAYSRKSTKKTVDDIPYKILTEDLEAILKALTDMDYRGMPLFRYTGEGYGIVADDVQMWKDVPSDADILEYHERRILAERRWEGRQKNLADRGGPVEDPTGFTVSAEATGSGPAQIEVDQLKEENRKLREEIQRLQAQISGQMSHTSSTDTLHVVEEGGGGDGPSASFRAMPS